MLHLLAVPRMYTRTMEMYNQLLHFHSTSNCISSCTQNIRNKFVCKNVCMDICIFVCVCVRVPLSFIDVREHST